MDVQDIPPQYSEKSPPPTIDPVPYTVQPDKYTPVEVAGEPPKSYLVHSILVILCCFWPLGAVALYKVIEARRLYDEGNYAQAQTSSKEAGQFVKFGCIIGCLAHGIAWGIVIVTYSIVGVTLGVIAATGGFNNITKTTS